MLLFLCLCPMIKAQIVGTITDAETGDTILYPTVKYKSPRLSVSGNAKGYYSIARHVGGQLSFSAMGYKTKTIVKMLDALKVTGKALIVTQEADKQVYKSAANIPGIKTAAVNTLNVYDILNYDTFIVSKGAVTKIEEVYVK